MINGFADDLEFLEPTKKGIKFDNNKRRFSLIPVDVLNEIIDCLEYGAKKYGDDNWQDVALEDETNMRYYNATFRHLTAWYEGERDDKESGLSHLSHAICSLMFQLWKDNKTLKRP